MSSRTPIRRRVVISVVRYPFPLYTCCIRCCFEMHLLGNIPGDIAFVLGRLKIEWLDSEIIM